MNNIKNIIRPLEKDVYFRFERFPDFNTKMLFAFSDSRMVGEINPLELMAALLTIQSPTIRKGAYSIGNNKT